MRVPVIAGNWKMNLGREAAVALVAALVKGLRDVTGSVEVGVAPPFPLLSAVADELRGSSVFLAAQNMHWEKSGAFTGEVSGEMLVEMGCSHVILGHSERRHVMGETHEQIAQKVSLAIELGLRPILCIGETLEQREADRTRDVVLGQLDSALSGNSAEDLQYLILAYEPVWAIGTGLNATPAQASEVHVLVRDWVAQEFTRDFADTVRIQYGGSVKASNAAELLAAEGVDGALVGGASLTLENFLPIVRAS